MPGTVRQDGTKIWSKPGVGYHREDGPAIEWVDSVCKWYLNGRLSRLEGPGAYTPGGYRSWNVWGVVVK